jgi:hypothetical protein
MGRRMTNEEFRELVTRVRAEHPVWFALESDPPATPAEIRTAEKLLGVTLPREYKEFVAEYGGGLFAMANVYSCSEGSEWNIAAMSKEFPLSGQRLLAVGDNGCGDAWVVRIDESGRCTEGIYFWEHGVREVGSKPAYDGLFGFVAARAFTS